MTDSSPVVSDRPIEAETSGGTPWLRWVMLGCFGVVILGIAGVIATGWAVIRGVKSSGAYQEALAMARGSPTVQEALGEPIEEGWWVMGSIEVTGPSGTASISFPISGPRGDATIYAEARKRAGEWTVHLLEAELQEGERIDLLDEDDVSLEVVRQFLELAAARDYEEAHELCSGALAEVHPLEEFTAGVRANPFLFEVAEMQLERVRGSSGPRYEGTLLLERGAQVPASFELVREGGEWLLISYQIGSG